MSEAGKERAEAGRTATPAGARVFLRPIASPAALGFAGLAGATLVLSGIDLGWFGTQERTQAAIIILAFAPPLQLLASVMAFLGRDPLMATGMGILAATWMAIGLVLATTPPGSTSDALGALLLVSAVALLFPASGAASKKGVPALVIGAAALRYALNGVFQTSGVTFWQDASGVFGIVLTALALYGALSLGLEDSQKRTVLPTLRRGKGRLVLERDPGEQAGRVGIEPGVREEL